MSCDLETVDATQRALASAAPALVVHAAGLTSVEECEADPDLAHHVNVVLAANVARAAAAAGLPLIHISTDHLYDGRQPMVDETHPLTPLNVYGRTKALAEEAVLHAHPRALVVRTNFYGWGTGYRHSFSDSVIRSLRAGQPVTLFEDVFYTPIHIDAQRAAVLDLLGSGASGTVNVVGDQRLSKHEFGMKVAAHFELDEGLITAGSIRDKPGLVRRPRDMSLSNERARMVLGRALGGVDDHLSLLKRQEDSGLAQELSEL